MPTKKFSCRRPLPQGISLHSWYEDFLRAKFHNCFYTITLYFQLFIHRNSRYVFRKRWNWQICHTHQAIKLNFHFAPLAGKLRTFPMVKLKTSGFLLDRTQQYTLVHLGKSPCELLLEKEQLSGHYAAYFEVDGMCYIYCPRDFTENCWKRLAEQLLVLQTRLSHHA